MSLAFDLSSISISRSTEHDSAMVWWKWHTVKELEDLASSQETASGQKFFT